MENQTNNQNNQNKTSPGVTAVIVIWFIAAAVIYFITDKLLASMFISAVGLGVLAAIFFGLRSFWRNCDKQKLKKRLIAVGASIAGVAVAVFALWFAFGQTEKAQLADAELLEISQEEASLSLWEDIDNVEKMISALSEREVKSLKNYSAYESKVAEYKALEDKAVAEIEEKIKTLPAAKDVKLASMEAIEDVEDAYNYAIDPVKERVSNKGELDKVVDELEKVKAECWVPCTSCGGDGISACRLCGGSGSRLVNHTTPNGKTWRVHQECRTTQSCSICSGKGGVYVEK